MSLFISDNRISSLPPGVFKWKIFSLNVSLLTINFAGNRLKELPQPLFESTVNRSLENLHLERNNLEYLPRDVFRGLSSLKCLFLFDNNIKWLGDETFQTTSIQKMFLFGNKLSELGDLRMDNYTEEIHLYSNPIKRVKKGALVGFSSSTTLFLNCDVVEEIGRTDIQLKCITPSYSPVFVFPKELEAGHDGFSCRELSWKHRECFLCPRGTFLNRFGKCVSCPQGGFYQDGIGSVLGKNGLACKQCPVGTFVKEGSGKVRADCKNCPEGTDKSRHAGFRACYCLDGYARVNRFGPCFVCLEKGRNCSGKDFVSIQPGYFWSWDFEEANVTLYKRFVSNLKVESNFYSDSDVQYLLEIPKAFKCPRAQSCKTSADDIETKCAEGYKGWLCGKCDNKFFPIMDKCFNCPNTNILWVVIICICILCYIIYRSIMYKCSSERNDFEHVRFSMYKVISRGKIVLAFYQIVGQFLTSVNHVKLVRNVYIIGILMPYLELNIFGMFTVLQCLPEHCASTSQMKFKTAVCFPWVLLFCSILYYHIQKVRLKINNRPQISNQSFGVTLAKLKSQVLSVTVIVMFITYPSTCTVIFQMYPTACETFCYHTKSNFCIKRLRSDYDLSCTDLTVYQVFAFVSTLCYIIAFPVSILFVLSHCARKKITSKGTSAVLNRRPATDEISHNESNETELWIIFLRANYAPQYWYWEVIELLRKVSQTALIPLFGWKNKFTVLLVVFLSCFYLNLHARLMPMKDKFEQNLQILCLTVTLINALLSAIEIAELPNAAVSIAFLILNASPLIMISVETIIWLIRGRNVRMVKEENKV